VAKEPRILPSRSQAHHLPHDSARTNPEALRAFDYSLAQMPQPATALRQAAALATAGFPELGLTHLDYFESLPPRRVRGYTMVRIHAWVLHQQGWWKSETAHLRKTLEDDAASKVAGGAIGA